MSDDPLEVIRKLAESHRQIKLGRGVVGKTSYLTAALFGIWAVVLFKLSDNFWLNGFLFGGGAIATVVYFWWVNSAQRFAKENPSLALLEGAEFIEYQKWEAEIKGQPTPKLPLVPNPDPPPALPESDAHK